MIVFVLNCGSSSLKFQLFDMQQETVLAKGLVERIGLKDGRFTYITNASESIQFTDQEVYFSHAGALQAVLKALTDEEYGVIEDVAAIDAIGHRVAHGGELFTSSALITPEVLQEISDCSALAPLHNPANVLGIEECSKLMPKVPQVAVFDTAFHQTMPKEAYLYAIPYEYYQKYKIRRYGFHGTSHNYVANRAANMLGLALENLKLISCHLGNGSSICAVQAGESVDTSMGFTPLDGIPMGTRSGAVDPAIIEFLMKKEDMSIEMVMQMLNRNSGVYGLSEFSSDFRDIETQALAGNHKCQAAFDVFVRAVKKHIGSYYAIMNGLDVLIFTAGIGENSARIREKICTGLEALGVDFDPEANVTVEQGLISRPNSKVKVMVVATNEELLIARDTLKIVRGQSDFERHFTTRCHGVTL